jgi:hypothetical protein
VPGAGLVGAGPGLVEPGVGVGVGVSDGVTCGEDENGAGAGDRPPWLRDALTGRALLGDVVAVGWGLTPGAWLGTVAICGSANPGCGRAVTAL